MTLESKVKNENILALTLSHSTYGNTLSIKAKVPNHTEDKAYIAILNSSGVVKLVDSDWHGDYIDIQVSIDDKVVDWRDLTVVVTGTTEDGKFSLMSQRCGDKAYSTSLIE